MANSVDPDQTAPEGAVWSGSLLFVYVILSDALVFEFLGHLLYILQSFKLNFNNPASILRKSTSGHYRAVIGPSATLTGRWRPDIDLRRMLTGKWPMKAQIKLCECTGWSRLSLSTYLQ